MDVDSVAVGSIQRNDMALCECKMRGLGLLGRSQFRMVEVAVMRSHLIDAVLEVESTLEFWEKWSNRIIIVFFCPQ